MHGEETAADADGRGRDPAYDAATAREDAGIVEAMLAAAHPERDGPPYPRERGAVERAPTIADTDAVYDGPVDLTSLDDGRYTRLCRAAGFVPRRGQVPGDLLDGYHATGGDATTDDIRADAPVSPFAGGDGGLARNALTHTQALAKLGGDDRPAGSDAHAYDDLDIAIHDTAIDDMREVRIELAPDDLDHLVHRARQRTTPGLLRDATGMSRELLHHHRSSDDRSGIALPQFARLYRLAVAAAPRYDLERAAPADTDLVERTEHPGNGQELYRLDTAYQQWLFSAVDPEEDALEQHARRIREYRRGGDRGIDPDVYDEVLDTVRARYDGVGEEHRVAFDDPVCARHPLSNLPQFDDHLFDDDTLTDRELYLAGMAGTDGMRMLARLDASDQRKVQVSYLVQYGAEFFEELRDIGYTWVKSTHFDLDDAPNSAAGYMCNAAVSLGVLALEEERSAHRSSLYRKEEPEALSDYTAFFDRLQPSE